MRVKTLIVNWLNRWKPREEINLELNFTILPCTVVVTVHWIPLWCQTVSYLVINTSLFIPKIHFFSEIRDLDVNINDYVSFKCPYDDIIHIYKVQNQQQFDECNVDEGKC